MGEPIDVCIHRECGLSTEFSKHHVGRLPPDTGKRGEVVMILGEPSLEGTNNRMRHSDQVSRLGLIVVDWPNDSLEIALWCPTKRREARVGAKERGSDFIHLLIGALRREDHCNDELILVLKGQFALRIGVKLPKEFQKMSGV